MSTLATSAERTATAPALGSKAASGFLWTVTQTVSVKLITLVSQLVMAWLLSPRDFGLLGLAMTVASFASIARDAGVRQVLVHRQRRFHLWANPAFWLSNAIGVLSAGLVAACAPLAGYLYGEHNLTPLIGLIACTCLLNAPGVVSATKLSIDLRFRLISTMAIVGAAFNTALGIALAMRGWGAASVLVPNVLWAAINSLWLLRVAWPPIRLRFDLRGWRYLLGDGTTVVLSQFFQNLMLNGDYAVLGWFFDSWRVGVYFFAFSLSVQAIALFTQSLGGVLLPVLGKLNREPVRQRAAFLRSTRMLAFVVAPVSFLQVVLAVAVIHVFFPEKWEPAGLTLRVLSFGMAFRAVGSASWSLIQAQGRFRTQLGLNIFYGVIYVGGCVLASCFGTINAVALFVAAFYAVTGPLYLYVAIRPAGGSWSEVLDVYLRPFACSLVAVVPAWLIVDWMPQQGLLGITGLVLSTIATTLVYLALARFVLQEELKAMLSHLSSRIRKPVL